MSERLAIQMSLGKMRGSKFNESLQKLLKLENVPPKVSFKLRAIVKAIQAHIDHFYEVQKKLLDEHALKKDGKPVTTPLTGGGESVTIDPDKKEDFDRKFKELCSLEVELYALQVSDFGDSIAPLTPEDYFQLEFLAE